MQRRRLLVAAGVAGGSLRPSLAKEPGVELIDGTMGKRQLLAALGVLGGSRTPDGAPRLVPSLSTECASFDDLRPQKDTFVAVRAREGDGKDRGLRIRVFAGRRLASPRRRGRRRRRKARYEAEEARPLHVERRSTSPSAVAVRERSPRVDRPGRGSTTTCSRSWTTPSKGTPELVRSPLRAAPAADPRRGGSCVGDAVRSVRCARGGGVRRPLSPAAKPRNAAPASTTSARPPPRRGSPAPRSSFATAPRRRRSSTTRRGASRCTAGGSRPCPLRGSLHALQPQADAPRAPR